MTMSSIHDLGTKQQQIFIIQYPQEIAGLPFLNGVVKETMLIIEILENSDQQGVVETEALGIRPPLRKE